MIYGDEKTHQMMRSILPSTKRSRIRTEKRVVKQANRAKVRQALHRGEEHIDYCTYPDIAISEIVWDRRNYDKLNHFERWAVQITKDMPKEERLPYLKRMLPDNLIGRHAYSHLERLDELGYYWERWNRYSATPVKKVDFKKELAEFLRKTVENGDQAKLNKAIKAAHHYSHLVTRGRTFDYKKGEGDDARYRVLGRAVQEYEECERCEKPRLFLGLGDIDSFIADVYAKHRHPEWREAVSKFYTSNREPAR